MVDLSADAASSHDPQLIGMNPQRELRRFKQVTKHFQEKVNSRVPKVKKPKPYYCPLPSDDLLFNKSAPWPFPWHRQDEEVEVFGYNNPNNTVLPNPKIDTFPYKNHTEEDKKKLEEDEEFGFDEKKAHEEFDRKKFGGL